MKNALNFKNWDKDHSKHAFLKNAYNTAKFQAYFWMTASAISVFLKGKSKEFSINNIFQVGLFFNSFSKVEHNCNLSQKYYLCELSRGSEWWLTLLKTLPYWLALFVTRYASRCSVQKIANYQQKRANFQWNTQCLIRLTKWVKKAK